MRTLSVTAAVVGVIVYAGCGARTGMLDDGDGGTCGESSFAHRGCRVVVPSSCETGEYEVGCVGIYDLPPPQCRFHGPGGPASAAFFCCPCST
jgi:hypothetical protein